MVRAIQLLSLPPFENLARDGGRNLTYAHRERVQSLKSIILYRDFIPTISMLLHPLIW